MAASPRFSIVLPVYNEEEGLEQTLKGLLIPLYSDPARFEIILIDDASTDETDRIYSLFPAVKAVRHPENRGYGAALKTGIRAARGEWIVILDGDATYPVSALPEMLEGLDSADMVMGIRKKITYPSLGFLKRGCRWGLNLLAGLAAGHRVRDMNTGMRVIRREKILPILGELSDRFSFTTGLTIAAYAGDWRVKNVEVDYAPRRGRSKVKLFRDGLRALKIILRGAWRYRIMVGVPR